jgi:hypothetical protein
MRYRALNVRAPFAQLIVSGRKTIEYREWATPHRGPIVIVSSTTRPTIAQLDDLGVSRDEADGYLYGYAIGLARLVDVRPGLRGDEQFALCDTRGGFAWVLRNARPIQPFRQPGRCGLYSVDARLVVSVQARRGATA